MSPRVEKHESHPFPKPFSPGVHTHTPPADESAARDNRAEIGIAVAKQVAPIRVLLMCSYPIEREGIRLIIEEQPGMTVVAHMTGNLEELSASAAEADIILVDIDSNGHYSLDHLPKLVEMAGNARIIVLTNACKQDTWSHIAHMGAMGVVSKNQAVETLLKSIRKVHSGEVWFERSTMAGLIRDLAAPRLQPCDQEAALRIISLTKREREVIKLLGQGLNAEEIGKRLFISETTVRHHLSSIIEKLGVRDRFELVFYAYRHGLAVPPTYASLRD